MCSTYIIFLAVFFAVVVRLLLSKVIENRNGDAIITSIFKIIASAMTIVATSISSEIPTCIQRLSFM